MNRICALLMSTGMSIGVSGCALWPGSGLPSAKEVHANAAQHTNADSCAESLDIAKGCARFLIQAFSDLEAAAGRWDTANSLTLVLLGTVGAIYLKSDSDRTQAIEDLAVGVAALGGIRSVLRPDERRKVAQEGRLAIECMLAAAEGLEQVAQEAKDSETKEQAAVMAAEAAESAKRQARAADRALIDAREAAADRDAASGRQRDAQRAAAATMRMSQAELEATTAARAAEDADERAAAKATPIQKFRRAVQSEFDLPDLDDLWNQADGGNRQFPPRDSQRFSVESLIGVSMLNKAETAADARAAVQSEAVAAKEVSAAALGFGVIQVLHNVRSALSEPAAATGNIAKTQRDAVHAMIGELTRKIETEQDAAKKLEGASETIPLVEAPANAADDVNAQATTAARRRLQTIFSGCTASAP